MDTFSDLADFRSEVRDATVHHADSVFFFLDQSEGSFFRTTRDRARGAGARVGAYSAGQEPRRGTNDALADSTAGGRPSSVDNGADGGTSNLRTDTQDQRKVHRLTTTFTCIESLADAGKAARSRAVEATREFVDLALEHPEDWKSEGAAQIYCRVRGLAPLLHLHGDALRDHQREAVAKLLRQAWDGVEAKAGSDGIFELGSSPTLAEVGEGQAASVEVEDRYPPNAYLTYWGLASLSRCDVLGITGDPAAETAKALNDKRRIAEIWLEKCLGTQVALHACGSRRRDPQQIAWAICGLMEASRLPLTERPTPALDLVRASLAAFFAEGPAGSWPRGEPLFHYPSAGNAYCYQYETLAELLNLSLQSTAHARELRQLLRPYATELVHAFRNAVETRRALEAGQPQGGWCSEHHPHRTSPESWATATVYRFFQNLRRLVGIWTRETAASALGAREPKETLETLRNRGDSWNAGYGSAGVQLSTLYVHPYQSTFDTELPDDPDVPALAEDVARSAMLFGPPGTGKTTLVEAVAGALGWRFIEVTPAEFLNQGVEMVSARADEVFTMLMELDRHVILFDEIDELIRLRNDAAEPIERFFTTTMLPRLTRLWKQGRVLFFVNTNSIRDVDPAVRRSQRFDTAIFVLPPSEVQKGAVLAQADADYDPTITYSILAKDASGVPPAQLGFGWMPFIRFDQLERLKGSLSNLERRTPEEVAKVLAEFGQEVFRSDWAPEGGDAVLDEAVEQFAELASYQRRDHSRARVVEVSDGTPPPDGAMALSDRWWRVVTPENDLSVWADSCGLRIDAAGRVSRPHE